MREKILFATWKDKLTFSQSIKLARFIVRKISDTSLSFQPVICPSFVALPAISKIIQGTKVKLAGQNMRWDDPNTTITGEISAKMLVEVGCNYVILGHSERRIYLGETNEIVHRKISSALKWGLVPVICVGEQYEDRKEGVHLQIIKEQVTSAVSKLKENEQKRRMVFAYEPAWSISTSPIAIPIDPKEANRMHRFIRDLLSRIINRRFAENITVVYGGSIDEHNAEQFFSQPEIDGGLVGTASQKADTCLRLVEVAHSVYSSRGTK